MKIAIRFVCILFSVMASVKAEGDMVIRGETMRHDTRTNITMAEGGAGMATAEWGANQALKKLQAKTIRAKMNDKAGSVTEKNAEDTHIHDINSLGQDIEWIEAAGQVQVTFPGRIMTAAYCKSEGKKINCTGDVTIVAGKNQVKGDTGSFDLEKDQYEISTNPKNKQQVEATLYSDAVKP